MAITNVLRFIGTGKPARANINPRLNHEPSRNAIQIASVESQQDFRATIKSKLQPSSQELGRKAQKLSKGTGFDITA